MGPSGRAGEVPRFRAAAVVAAVLLVVFAVLLLPFVPSHVRSGVTSLGLLVGGLAAIGSGLARASRTTGADRRAWLLLSGAGLLPLAGNLWVALTGADPVTSPSLLGDTSIALGLVVSILGVLAFPTQRRRGLQLATLVLDGLVAGTAMVVIFWVLVYAELRDVDSSRAGGDALTLGIPVLDIVLATVAIILVLRSERGQRLTLGLVGLGFLLYSVADLTFAVRVARGTFEFGSLLDLGWIAGYLVLALSAWTPPSRPRPASDRSGPQASDALGPVLVFGVLLVALLVQFVLGDGGPMPGGQAAAWVFLVLAVGARQTALTADNTLLRRGLERRVAEQTADLARLAHQTELLLESVGDGIYGVDRDGRITFVNVRAAATLGWSAAELHDRTPHDVFLTGEDGVGRAPWTGSPIERAMAAGVAVTSTDDVYRRADGSTFPVEGTAAPLLEGGEVIGAVVVFRDITQRREVDRMKNEFLAVVSHELRTPLTSIRASLELIEDGDLGELPPVAGRMITVAREGSERLTRLINDLLDIERIESGAAPMTIASLDARELLDDAAEQLEGVVGSMGMRLEIGRAEGRVLADEDQIMQALTNLVGNACKFSEPGSTVRIDAVQDGPQVLVTVADHGRGIPADKLDMVFDRFAQVDSSDARQKGGTGLGLTITKNIITRHGGRIWAESTLGVGTTISFTLPAARPVEQPDLTPWTARAEGVTVLVCDDDPGVVEALSTVLAAHGYRPVGTTEGADVPGLIESEHPAVVLLDLLMPGTTGSEVLAAMRGDEEAGAIPVVVVSGLGPEAAPGVADATEGWLVKPISEERLVRAVAVAQSGRPSGGTVLLVEDDDQLAGSLAQMLERQGLEVVRAATATDAVLRGQELRPDVVVLDLLLPDGHGSDVVAELRRRGSLASTALVVYSGTTVGDESREALRLGETTFMDKGRTSPRELTHRVVELVRAATETGRDHPAHHTEETGPHDGGRRRGAPPGDPPGTAGHETGDQS